MLNFINKLSVLVGLFILAYMVSMLYIQNQRLDQIYLNLEDELMGHVSIFDNCLKLSTENEKKRFLSAPLIELDYESSLPARYQNLKHDIHCTQYNYSKFFSSDCFPPPKYGLSKDLITSEVFLWHNFSSNRINKTKIKINNDYLIGEMCGKDIRSYNNNFTIQIPKPKDGLIEIELSKSCLGQDPRKIEFINVSRKIDLNYLLAGLTE